MTGVSWFDLAIVLLYLLLMTGLGMYFSRRQTTTDNFFIARKRIPSWAMGMSILATMVSSVTFVAYPGSAYAKDWSLLVPGFMLIAVLPLVGRVNIPFYRDVVGMSVYEYFEKRFGRPVRFYSAFAFSLAHFSKMGFVLYLMALTLSSITGWSIHALIAGVGAVMILYAVKGGIEAIVWADVVQGLIMGISIIVVLAFLLFLPAGGPAAVIGHAWAADKFRLSELHWNLRTTTIPVLLLYGLCWYLQRYVADQTLVQRYLMSKSDNAAFKGVKVGAFLSVPVWALFMLVGTCVWSYFQITAETIPASITKADQMFPYFLGRHLPSGLLGLLLACLTGAAMTMLASDINSMAVVAVEDFYRYWKPKSTDRDRLFAAKAVVLFIGILNIGTALLLAKTKGSALSSWFAVSAIASGGLLGLFLLAFVTRRAHRLGAYCGILGNLLFSVWAVFTKGPKPMVDLGNANFPLDELMIGVIGNALLFCVGLAASYLIGRPENEAAAPSQTVWNWLANRHSAEHRLP